MNYPPLPDLSTSGDIWRAILEWEGKQPGHIASMAADNIDEVFSAALRAYVDADRAQRAAQQERKPMTEYELVRCTDDIRLHDRGCFILVARAVEAFHNIKETP